MKARRVLTTTLVLATAMVAVAAALLAIVWMGWLHLPGPDLGGRGFRRARLEVRHGPSLLRAETAGPTALSAIAAVLDSGESTGPHRCASRATLYLEPDDATEPVEVSLMPGHVPGYYEFRMFWTYRVDRTRLLQVLAPFGIPPAKLLGDDH